MPTHPPSPHSPTHPPSPHPRPHPPAPHKPTHPPTPQPPPPPPQSLPALAKALTPTRPGEVAVLTGFLAGLLAGGLGAAAYAADCPDDSPLFVMTWYPVGILALGALGAFAGSKLLRW